jgi:P27 family predicted phage terminase small subunit
MTLRTIEGGDGLPPEPDWSATYNDVLDQALARETWGQVTREMMEAGTLAVVNGHAIQRLVNFRIIYERAARAAAEQGAVIKAKKTGVLQYSPHWIVSRQADDAMRALEAELGISPLRRSRAGKAVGRARKSRPADRYLGGK